MPGYDDFDTRHRYISWDGSGSSTKLVYKVIIRIKSNAQNGFII